MNKTVGFKTIATDKLRPSEEAAQFPTDADDRTPIDLTMAEEGLIQPLVVRQTGPDAYEIIDGVGRWEAAKKLGLESVECKEVTCDDARMLVLAANSAGRKRMVGGRVLAYLEMHREQVIRAAQASWFVKAAQGVRNHSAPPPWMKLLGGLPLSVTTRLTSGSALPEDLAPFTARAVAERLQVDDKTVGKAVELLCCGEARCDQNGVPLDGDGLKRLRETHEFVIKGYTPVNRWAARLGGKITTEGVGRSKTDYPKLAVTALTSLRNTLAAWNDIEWPNAEKRQAAEDLLQQCVGLLPSTLNGFISAHVVQSFRPHELKTLEKQLKERSK